jgi:hypothetical protein
MLRVSPRIHSPDYGGPGKREDHQMGNAVVAEELAGSDELDELFKLDASETEPEDEDDEDDEEGDEEDDEDAEKPDVVPHG